MGETIEKVSVVISKGSLDGVYPGLIMANGARAEGIHANLFFTFFGLDASYDGHANCFIETGFHKALLIDFNYDTEPLPGRFPSTIGMPLLKESRLNHLGKLMFQWFYWHTLLPGRDIPGVGSDMPLAGKNLQTET